MVVDSYAQLAAEGNLSAKCGSATRVALLPTSANPPRRRQVSMPEYVRYDLRPGMADFHAFPRARWKATGIVMTVERRAALITWARERQALIVEDHLISSRSWAPRARPWLLPCAWRGSSLPRT